MTRILVATLAAAMLLSACGDESADDAISPADLSTDQEIVPTAEFSTDEEQDLAEIARALALTLSSPGHRNHVYLYLQESPNIEHKRLAADFFEAAPASLRADLEQHLLGPWDSFAEILRAAGPLEIYFPVETHRQSWTPSENLLVATALSEEHEIAGFDLQGQFILLDDDAPPTIPVLAVVPAEGTPKPRPSQKSAANGSAALTTGSTTLVSADGGGNPYVEMNYIEVQDDHEGWLQGNAEFEVHTEVTSVSGDSWQFSSCAGQYAGSPFYYDFNGGTWTGSVRLTTLPTDAGTKYRFLVWERDTGDCAWPSSAGDPIVENGSWSYVVWGIGSVAVATDLCKYTGQYALICAAGALGAGAAYYLLADNSDDAVGQIAHTGRDDCWNDVSNPVSFKIDRDGTQTGIARLSFHGVENGPTCPDGAIQGDDYVETLDPHEYSAVNVSGGFGTYAYQWYTKVSGEPLNALGTGSSEWIDPIVTAEGYFYVVLDINSEDISTRRLMTVWVDDSSGSCLECPTVQ